MFNICYLLDYLFDNFMYALSQGIPTWQHLGAGDLKMLPDHVSHQMVLQSDSQPRIECHVASPSNQTTSPFHYPTLDQDPRTDAPTCPRTDLIPIVGEELSRPWRTLIWVVNCCQHQPPILNGEHAQVHLLGVMTILPNEITCEL